MTYNLTSHILTIFNTYVTLIYIKVSTNLQNSKHIEKEDRLA